MDQMQEVDWLQMHFAVPVEWSIVRHGLRTGKGRLLLADRRDQRMQLSWTRCANPPDLTEAIRQYREKDRLEWPTGRFVDLTPATPWRGYRHYRDDSALTRAGRYESRLRRWIEMTLDWPHGCDTELETAILQSFRVPDESRPRWRAFGVDVHVPNGYQLARAEVKPARVTLRFENGRSELTVHRRGMVEAWSIAEGRTSLARQFGRTCPQFESGAVAGHHACMAHGEEETVRIRRFLGQARQRCDAVWHCPSRHAVWHLDFRRPRGDKTGLDDFPITCCLSPVERRGCR